MVKKYSIVEFSDGVQVIPSCWMNATKTESGWPGYVKNSCKLNKIIIQADLPEMDEAHHQWVKWPIIKWFGSADTYKRAVEMRDRAVDTSTILDSDVVEEGGQRTENKELRRKHGDDVCMPTAEAPLAKKKKKKSKHCGISEVDVENAPTYSSTLRKLTTMNLNEFPTMPFGEGNSMEIASGPVPQTSTANEKNTTTFDFQEFMIRHTKKNSLAIKEMGERLKLIEEKLPNRTVNERYTCDNVFNPTDLGLPVTTEEGLSNLDSKLQDPSTFINMTHFLTRCGGNNVALTTAKILEKLMGSCIAEKYSWHGRKHKKIFRNFSHIVDLILSSVHATCSQTQCRCTDLDIILAAGKWFAQAKTRNMRAELRMLNKEHRQPTFSGEIQNQQQQQPFSADAQQAFPAPANALQPFNANAHQPSHANAFRPSPVDALQPSLSYGPQ